MYTLVSEWLEASFCILILVLVRPIKRFDWLTQDMRTVGAYAIMFTGYGVWQLTEDAMKVSMYGVPLVGLVPFVLIGSDAARVKGRFGCKVYLMYGNGIQVIL